MIKNEIFISVIVPLYNAQKTIGRCIESILAQSFRGFELILIDDGSEDMSGKICDGYRAKTTGINVIVIHKRNGGVSNARNVGIMAAKGEYLVFIDSDDYIDRKYLENFVVAKSKYPEIGHIWCGFKSVQQTGEIEECFRASDNDRYSFFSRNDYMILSRKWFTQMPWHRLYKRETIINNHILMKEHLSLGEDIIFNLEYLDAENNDQILIINEASYNYVQDSDYSLNHKYRNDLLEVNDIINKSTRYYLKKWKVDQYSWNIFYDEAFYRYENVFKNTFDVNNKMTHEQRICYVNSVLKTKEFKEVLRNRKCSLNVMLKFAYKTDNYRLYLILKKAARIKSKFFNKLN